LHLTSIYVDREVADSPIVERICRRLDIEPDILANKQALFDSISEVDDPVGFGKTILYLTRNKGPFIRSCPGTRTYTCCGLQILHTGTYCTMDCAYCILQCYFHPPVLSHFVNYSDLFDSLDRLFSGAGVSRVCTGEFTDSLIWEECTDQVPQLVDAFSSQKRAVLELKTKTVRTDRLCDLSPRGKTILAWSLNTDRAIRQEERGTASLTARIRAAAACAAAGYPLAFHFDPILIYPGCEEDYRGVIRRLFKDISGDQVIWISLGTFRYMPDLKPIVARRFPLSKIPYGEFIAGLDGKMRYFKPLRIEIYEKLVGWIREAAPDVLLYFCMEDDEVWERSVGFAPGDRGGLPHLLDERAARFCGLDLDVS